MSTNSLLVENLKGLIAKEKNVVLSAENRGDWDLVGKKCDYIITMLQSLVKLDPGSVDYYRRLEKEWIQKRRNIGKQGSSHRRNSGESNENNGKQSSTRNGLIGEMEKEFKARIQALVSRDRVSWDQIGGLEYEKRVLKEAIFFAAASPDLNVEVPNLKNIILYGPPGTGKTTLARAVSSTLSATFYNASLTELFSRYLGDSERLVKTLFQEARKNTPSVIFVDEVESLFRNRDDPGNSHSTGVLQEFMRQLDGFTEHEFVMVIAATNQPWILDTAILSRFEKRIFVSLPDEKTRESILEIHTKKKGFEVKCSLPDLASKTQGFSGRDLFYVCNEAIRNMLRRANSSLIEKVDSTQNSTSISRKYHVAALLERDFTEALSKVKPVQNPDLMQKYSKWSAEYGER